nr:CusA/CzcA family heavy metal efflux RND transporter [Oceanococcus sp. HetDA_MAG_MS8]
MLKIILDRAIRHRVSILLMTLVLSGLGLWNLPKLAIDAVPDITNVQVQINTDLPGYTPLESEQRVTLPLEWALGGLAGLDYIRSISRYGLSQVTVAFDDQTDLYFARQQVAERLQTLRSQLPPGAEPQMGPAATGLGEISMYVLDKEPSADVTPMQLREVQDWIVRPQLLRVDGVADVNAVGGYRKQYLVYPDLRRLQAMQLSLEDLADTLGRNNLNQGASFIEGGGQQVLLRVPAQIAGGSTATLEDIGALTISTHAGAPIRVRDVAEVAIGSALRTGAATQNGREVVLGTVLMRVGENSRTVARAVAERIDAIRRSLPPGVSIDLAYDRTRLVDKTLATVQTNLLEGALLVIGVLFIMLGNLRAALITAMVIPLSMLLTVTGMVQTGVSANLMSLGALDFGLIVDGAVIITENCLSRLAALGVVGVVPLRQRLQTVFVATHEVIRPALFGVFIITVVYLPIFALSGIEGKMFHPMAQTVVMALLAAMLLSITAVPAAIAIFVRNPPSTQHSRLQPLLAQGYAAVLQRSLQWRRSLLLMALGLVLISAASIRSLGSEFLPSLDEGDIAMHALRIPGTGLQQSVQMQEHLEAVIKTMPEVERVVAKIGTADIASDPMPPSVADNFIILKDRKYWPDPHKPKDQVVAELAALVADVPGNNYEFTQPIQMRFNELLSGVRADLAVKVYGDDLEQLATLGAVLQKIVAGVPGAADVNLEQTTGLPVLSIEPRREVLRRYDLDVADLQNVVSAAYAGRPVGQIFTGDRRHTLMIRLPEAQRQNLDDIRELLIPLPQGGYQRLGQLATISRTLGPNQINRDNAKRRVVVTANVRNRDLGSFVAELQAAVQAQLDVPPGYWIGYGGSFEQLQSASRRLALVVPVTLALIIGLLWMSFGALRDALLIFSGVPLAMTGGLAALHLRDIPFSISAGVGFIALSGIAVLNGLVMISVIRQRLLDGQTMDAAILEGARSRLRPVLMTALVAALGFVPMALNTGIGSEVQRPLASVVVGGILSATVLTLLVLPALYRQFGRPPKVNTEPHQDQALYAGSPG